MSYASFSGTSILFTSLWFGSSTQLQSCQLLLSTSHYHVDWGSWVGREGEGQYVARMGWKNVVQSLRNTRPTPTPQF